jgi:DNA-directed RNA polymerase subunit alpha
MPQILTLQKQNDYGKFVLEPLERGFGHTIGNAFRRVLLSSIQGASIAAIKIDKVLHEFAPIPGVKEDTTELILNLKDVAIRVANERAGEEHVLTINVKGPGRVTGADIVCPEGVEVVNPEVYIATVSDADAVLAAEFYVGWGTGYVLPERQERYKGIIGTIPTGSQYTPVKKVNYTVEQTRVGMRTDFERLVLEVHTNGAVSPNDALTQAAHILDKHIRFFFDLGEAGFEGSDDELDPNEEEMLRNVPEIRIEELDFSQRTFNCLRRAGILTLRHLAATTEPDLTAIRGFGRKSLLEVRDKLQEHNLELRAPKGGYRPVELYDEDDEEDF